MWNPWDSNSLKCHDLRVVVIFAFTFPQAAAAGINFRAGMVQGLVLAIFAEHSSSQHSFKCAREGPALMHYAGTSVIIWFRGALRGAASLGFGHGTWRGRRSALQSCGLCMWASSWSLKPPQSEIRPNSVSLTALIQARQSRTPDSTLRLCYRAIRVQRARSLANFTGAIFREWESYTRWNWPGACIAIVLH